MQTLIKIDDEIIENDLFKLIFEAFPPFLDEYFYNRLQKIHIINRKEGRKYSIREVDADDDPNNKQ